jgi:hypothetical protein
MAEPTREERLQLANEAKVVRGSRAFKVSVELCKAKWLDQSLLSKTVEERERARAMVLALVEVVGTLDELVMDGEYAEKGIESEKPVK